MIEAGRAVLLPLWPALAGAAALGLIFGLIAWRERPAGFWGRLGLIIAAVMLVGGAVLAFLGGLPGRPGLWLETALAIGLAYLAGCIVGGVVRAIWMRAFARAGGAAPAG